MIETETIPVPVYAVADLIDAAIAEGVGDRVGAAIAHLQLIARREGVDLPRDSSR